MPQAGCLAAQTTCSPAHSTAWQYRQAIAWQHRLRPSTPYAFLLLPVALVVRPWQAMNKNRKQ